MYKNVVCFLGEEREQLAWTVLFKERKAGAHLFIALFICVNYVCMCFRAAVEEEVKVRSSF